jgi:hypothetical protein
MWIFTNKHANFLKNVLSLFSRKKWDDPPIPSFLYSPLLTTYPHLTPPLYTMQAPSPTLPPYKKPPFEEDGLFAFTEKKIYSSFFI